MPLRQATRALGELFEKRVMVVNEIVFLVRQHSGGVWRPSPCPECYQDVLHLPLRASPVHIQQPPVKVQCCGVHQLVRRFWYVGDISALFGIGRSDAEKG